MPVFGEGKLPDEDSGGSITYTIKDKPITIKKNTTPKEPSKILKGRNGAKMKITKVIIIADKIAMIIPRKSLVNNFFFSCRIW